MDLPHYKVVKERKSKLIEISTSCPEKSYLELRVPDEAYSVEEVIFTISSHDQGYSGEPRFYGTYENSFTWFVAAILSPGGHDRVLRNVIQHNVHADIKFKKHTVSWRTDSLDPYVVEWIKATQGGDCVHIYPAAQYPAWINSIESAEIEVRYNLAPVDALNIQLSRPVDGVNFKEPRLYRNLNRDIEEVRLILLQPGSFEDPILCSMTYTPLKGQDTSQFEALSYCWGDYRQRDDIRVTVSDTEGFSEFFMSITLSLHSALLKLRPQSGLARVLWVDAICINQNDLDERSSQVTLMRDIYRSAQRVVVWLGKGTEETHKAIKTLDTINNRYQQNSSWNGSSSQSSLLHSPLMELVKNQNHPEMFDFVRHWTLFESPWFNRTWVVQEAFNARETTFYCGDDTLELSTMLRVNKCISMIQGLQMNSSQKIMLPPIYDDLFHARFATSDKETMQLGILEVLIRGLDLDATDPRDKIFAMLQFGKETQNTNSLSPELVPDYRRPASEVFSSFTKWWIVQHQSLRILSALHALEGRAWQDQHWDTPPRHGSEQSTWSWWHRGRSNWAIGVLGLKQENPYRASADTKPDISLITECKQTSVLPLTGITIDIIKECAPYPYFNPPRNLENLHRAYVGIFDPLNLTGKWQHQMRVEKRNTYVFSDDIAITRAHYAAHENFAHRTSAVECNNSVFFTTETGLVGLCPSAARIGDIVVVFYGGSVPCVLREISVRNDGEKRYEFIGECYLESYMEGRAIDDRIQNGLLTEVFSLV